MVNKSIKFGWFGGTIGGYIFLPIIAFVFYFTGNVFHSIFCLILYIGIMIYVIKITPWKHPDTSIGKLMIPLMLPMVLLSLLLISLPVEYEDEKINIWQFVLFIPLFTMPVMINWKRTFNNSHKTTEDNPKVV